MSNTSKNNLTLTPTSKPTISRTWNEATYTWDASVPETWDTQYFLMTNTSKTSITLTPTSK